MSIFSPPSSLTMSETRVPRVPMQAPTASTSGLWDITAIFVLEPASRATALISTVPSKNFRHFLLKQAADKIRVRAGDDGLRALFGLLNVYNVDLYVVAFLDVFGTDLLSLRQNGFCLADLQGQRTGLRVYTLYKGADGVPDGDP